MHENSESDPHTQGSEVEPSVKREHLNKTWIGLGAALEWVALRGQPIPLKSCRDREDEADEMLVSTLADLPPAIAEAMVRGQPESDPTLLVPIPSGIWRQTATSDANDAGQPYRLIGTDDDDPWEGAILGIQFPGYRRIQIRSAFILETWPEDTMEIEIAPIRAVARADIRRVVEIIVGRTPEDIAPISQGEMENLVRSIRPEATRDMVRELHRDIFPNPKRGPKRHHDPERKARIEKFREEIVSAELRN